MHARVAEATTKVFFVTGVLALIAILCAVAIPLTGQQLRLGLELVPLGFLVVAPVVFRLATRGQAVISKEHRSAASLRAGVWFPVAGVLVGLGRWAITGDLAGSAVLALALIAGGLLGSAVQYWRLTRMIHQPPHDADNGASD
ncbi:MAG: hypothetical protein ACRDQ5_20325 [Sciscionella sp.]